MKLDNKKPLTIRCDANILDKCKLIAKINRRSLNAQIEDFLYQSVISFEKTNGEFEINNLEE